MVGRQRKSRGRSRAARVTASPPEPSWSPEVICVHTYKPARGVPLRGRLVVERAYTLAVQYGVPVFFAGGHTVGASPMLEGETYAAYMQATHGKDVAVETYNDPNVRDTHDETLALALMVAREQKRRVLVVALAPHLPRALEYWDWTDHSLDVRAVGVVGPRRYSAWELAMEFLEVALPPRSRRRKFAFWLAGRGPR